METSNKWFTLIEILIWILIFVMVIIWWFKALSWITLWKVKLIEKTNLTKDIVYFTQKLFEEIKTWWTVDYEEYFNRKVVWLSTSSWHYNIPTWFGNFWSGWVLWSTWYGDNFYFCKSWSWVNMWTWWCFDNIFNTYSSDVYWKSQRYWQYAFQFIDYNSNENDDDWDENWDWNLRWDDDDENLWMWPITFTWGENVKELYLISWDRKKRILFRWTFKEDPWPNKPSLATCNWATFWSGCIWNIEILKLDWKDWWVNHNFSIASAWSNDWIIDTWMIDPNFWTWTQVIAWTDNNNYWQPMFPDTISVSDFQVYLYPNTDIKKAWKNNSNSTNINPYLRLSITLEPSWKKRSWMPWEIPKYTLNTTINLVDYFSK